MPATGKLILMNADEHVASAAYPWSSGSWTRLKLQVEKADGGKVRVRGKAWADGTDEPKDWMVQFEDAESPQPSRAGAFGTPIQECSARLRVCACSGSATAWT